MLFVTNGHGEVAIAAKIAEELTAIASVGCDHLALVGDFVHPSVMRDAGPRRRMPSGGLLAMGNVRNILRDVRAGLIAHTLAQLRFLNGARGTYAAAIAVGDVFALLMAFRASTRTAFIGTAKSVYVAPYGTVEEHAIRPAMLVYVRDEATASRLQAHGIPAHAGNVIVDLFESGAPLDIECRPKLALFPGSRQEAYRDGAFLCAVVRELAGAHPNLCAMLSIAPGLSPASFCEELERANWRVERTHNELQPFVAYLDDRTVVHAWTGPIGSMLQGADAALGQAGTANEAAAAAGIPVVAFARSERDRIAWYRRRQAGLLGEALLVVRGDTALCAREVDALLSDGNRRRRMGETGRQRMGAPGASKRIAHDIADLIA